MGYVYGHFSDDGTAFLITRPDTPRPWLNHLSNGVYGLCLSQLGFGYSYYRAEIALRVTAMTVDTYVPVDPPTGRFIYLRDRETGDAWPATPLANSEFEKYGDYVCRDGLGEWQLQASRDGILTTIHVFVPQTEDPVELWEVTFENRSGKTRRLRFFPYLEWYLSSHPATYTDVFAYNQADFDARTGSIIARMTNPESCVQYGGFLTGDYRAVGYDAAKTAFLGREGSLLSPEVPRRGRCRNSAACAERMVGVVAGDITLRPGEKKSVRILAGVADSARAVARLKRKYLAPGARKRELERLRGRWRDIIAHNEVRTPSRPFNLTANIWLKYQLTHTAKWTRGLDRGYRDVLQDAMGIAPFWPEFTRQRFLESLAYQFRDGTAMRQWSEIGGPHDLRKHRDSPSWLIWCLEQYVLQTGDFAILNEEVPFFDGGEASVYEHVLRGVRTLYRNRGAHGMCLIGDGDWNDALNEIGKRGHGESVWLSSAAVMAARKVAALARHVGDGKVAREMEREAASLAKQIRRVAWHKGQFTYAFDDDGRRIGSPENPDGKLHLNVETWAIFTDVATAAQRRRLFSLIDGRLDTPYGPVLIHPPYRTYQSYVGRISGMVPGMFENGAVYSHGVSMTVRADCHAGRGSKAFETFMKAQPINPAHDRDRVSVEPFASTNFYMGPGAGERLGASLYSWHTGSISWFFLLAHQFILGLRPEYEGLRIDPCIPTDWREAESWATIRGARYHLVVKNPHRRERGVARVSLNGKPVVGTLLPYAKRGERCEIVAELD
jgi:cellobiose phosphorylase